MKIKSTKTALAVLSSTFYLSEIGQVGSQTSIQVAQQRVVAADIEMVAKMEDC